MNQENKRVIFSSNAKLTVTRKTFDATPGANADATDEGKGLVTLRGYPIVFNQLSTDRGGYVVRILPGSISFTPKVLALWCHDFSKPIGNTDNGTLRILPEDDYGIPVEIDLPDTTVGRDADELVETGLVTGMSFSLPQGFEDSQQVKENGQTIIEVTKAISNEVTITPIPAFDGATIAVVTPESDDPADFSQSTKERDRLLVKLLKYRLNSLSL